MAKRSTIEHGADAVARADAKLTSSARPVRDQPGFGAIAWASKLGDQPPLRTLCALVIGGGIVARSPRLFRAGLRMLAAHEVATLAKDFVKARVDRTRPRSARTQSERTPRAGRGRSTELRSFPSGHSAGSMAVARAFSREFPEYELPAVAGAVAVAAVQIPRFTHYGSDVAAGLAIGAATEAATDLVLSPAPTALPEAPLEAS